MTYKRERDITSTQSGLGEARPAPHNILFHS